MAGFSTSDANPGALSEAEEATPTFAALRATRQERDDPAAESGAPVPLCPVRLADGTPCFLPLPHEKHRRLGSGGEGRTQP